MRLRTFSRNNQFWLLFLPTILFFYGGLYFTVLIWYPHGLTYASWQVHLIHFTIVYVFWSMLFFSYRLFDWDSLRSVQMFLKNLISVLAICLLVAVVYFYFQPVLELTPRRFLLIHIVITGLLLTVWYLILQQIITKKKRRHVYILPGNLDTNEVKELIENYHLLGLNFAGTIPEGIHNLFPGSIVIVPERKHINFLESRILFEMRRNGVNFIEYQEMHEILTRTINLSQLSDSWFIHSFDYDSYRLFDIVKRSLDIVAALIAIALFILTFPFIALITKCTSKGPVLFKQKRVGQGNEVFTIYKYRTMKYGEVDNTWTELKDNRISAWGRLLRATRIDELPQAWNILKGEMSIVGPRPEQVNIVEQLREQIPYYDERHIVKPGLTGWAQLHVYAGTLEETKRKLQYDLYYIKNRSLLFDMEIILKTVYNIITFAGR